MTPHEKKSRLRRQLRKEIAQLDSQEREEGSRQVCAHLAAHTLWREASLVLLYAPLNDEVDIWPLLEQALLGKKKRVALPRFSKALQGYEVVEIIDPQADLTRGRFGVMEPKPSCPRITEKHLDLLLIPGLGFSRNGERMGRGLGYYDRLLARLEGPKCGLAFDCQIHESLPKEPHDQGMDMLLTPSLGLIRVKQAEA